MLFQNLKWTVTKKRQFKKGLEAILPTDVHAYICASVCRNVE